MSDEGFLPEWADIKPSTIEGVRYGIFTNQPILEGAYLGWVRRTDLSGRRTSRSDIGSIGNCNDVDPNTHTTRERSWDDDTITTNLHAARNIDPGEEITWTYTLPIYNEPGSRPWDVAS